MLDALLENNPMRKFSYYLIDVFTNNIFGGNPLAVFPEATGLADGEMQLIAAELNLSETTFVFPSDKPPAKFRVRIFTPIMELRLAGHPTVGTHFVLAGLGRYELREPETRVHQEVKAGILPVDLLMSSGRVNMVRMTQAPPEFLKTADDFARVAQAVGLKRDDLLTSPSPQVVSTGEPQLMIPVKSRAALSRMIINKAELRQLCDELETTMAYLFALEAFDAAAATHGRFASAHFDFEDPATGSASGGMAAYLVHYGLMPAANGIANWLHEQGHFMNRPSQIHITVHGRQGAVEIVQVAGAVVNVGRGEIYL